MREQLIRYVDLLFAGAPNAYDIKQEILQNTLDRYDDLVDQGKSPEAAYSLAISGIGDINEILGSDPTGSSAPIYEQAVPAANTDYRGRPVTPVWKKVLRAVAICLYIICPIPLFVLGEIGMDTIGLCGTLAIVAVATALMVIAGGKNSTDTAKKETPVTDPQTELRKAIKTIIWVVGIGAYLIISNATNGWWITWLIFPIIGAIQGLVTACMDLKEASKHEI